MIKVIILGIIQGFTEFLPISSSGHLAIVESLMGIEEPVVLAVFLHFGTFLATILFFYREIYSIIKGLFKNDIWSRKHLLYIIIGNIPIVLFALIFKDLIESTFTEIKMVLIFLGITGVILVLTSIIKKQDREISLFRAVIVGIGQMFAVFPGLSRSGLTISSGLFVGLRPHEAFNFSFLLSLPAVLGANILEFKDITNWENPIALIAGMLTSFISGLVALRILRSIVQKFFYLFGFYCLIISIIMLIFAD